MTDRSGGERLWSAIYTARRLSTATGKRYRIYWIHTCDGWQPVIAPHNYQPPTNRRRDYL